MLNFSDHVKEAMPVMSKLVGTLLLIVLTLPAAAQRGAPVSEEVSCQELMNIPNVTVTRTTLKAATGATPQHCYLQGLIAGRIRFHMQLPLPDNWNGRLLNIGDGGKDGVLDYANNR